MFVFSINGDQHILCYHKSGTKCLCLSQILNDMSVFIINREQKPAFIIIGNKMRLS